MAKTQNLFSFKDLIGSVDASIKGTSIMRETHKTAAKRTMIPTGIYVLNAAMSGSLFGGIADNRITILGGPSGVGKSFLCYSIVKQAQAQGYFVFYIDTEFAIELDQLPGYGIDTAEDKFSLIRSNVIEDLKIFMTRTLDKLKDVKGEGKDFGKVMFVLDSMGQLGSRKEIEDALGGKEKADFTKAKALGSLFRIINSDLGFLKIPLLATNHTYETMDMFPQTKMKGGEGAFYSASTIAFLTKAKLKEGIEDDLDLGQSGIVVTAKMVKNRMAKPKKVKFEISFVSGCNPYVGLDYWLTPENFEQLGICKGKMVGDQFVAGGNRWYVHHLGGHVKGSDLFSGKVFTPEVLKSLEPIINDYFKFKSITEIEEINKRLEESGGKISEKELYGAESLNSSSIFEDDEEEAK